MRAKSFIAGLVLMASVLAGCAFTKFETPKLDVVDVQMLKSDLLQQQLRLRMRVQNPNDRSLPVSGITYNLLVAGDEFARGQSERNFVVPALGSAEFDVSVTANAAATVMKMLLEGRKLDSLDYRLTGKVALSSGMLRSIPFDEKGVIRLR